MKKFLTIDFESFVHIYDYFPQNQHLSSIQRKNLDKGYIVQACREILQILRESETYATFFIVGEIFEWYPHLVEEIKSSGHEIGWHSHTHQNFLTPEVFDFEYQKSKNFIEKYHIKALRAPNMYMPLEVYSSAASAGFELASSCYGLPKVVNLNGLLEIPVNLVLWGKYELKPPTTLGLKLLLSGFPVGSGYAWGVLGRLMNLAISYLGNKHDYLMLTVHPWQIVSPKWVTLGILSRIAHKPIIIPYLFNINWQFRLVLSKNDFARLTL